MRTELQPSLNTMRLSLCLLLAGLTISLYPTTFLLAYEYPARIVCNPDTVNVRVGNRSFYFGIQNEGDADLRGRFLSVWGLPFQDDWQFEFEVQPGDEIMVEIYIEPEQLLSGIQEGGLVISTNDPLTPEYFLPINYLGDGPQLLTASSKTLAIPTLQIEEEFTTELQLVNHWNRPISITGIESQLDCISWSAPDLPVEIAVEDTLNATISFLSHNSARYMKSMFIIHYARNDLSGSLLINTSNFDAKPWPKAEFQPRYCLFEPTPDENERDWEISVSNEGGFQFSADVSLWHNGNANAFTYRGPNHIDLEPGNSVGLPVNWVRRAPNRDGHYAWIALRNGNDPRREYSIIPIVVIPLEEEPLLEITPPVLDFGQLPIGQPQTREITIRNLADSPVDLSCEVTSYLAEFGFGFSSVENSIQDLAAGGDTTLQIEFMPFVKGSSIEELHIEGTYPDGQIALRNTVVLADVVFQTSGIPDYSADTLFFEVDSGTVTEQQFIVSNIGDMPFTWEADAVFDYNWLAYNPVVGDVAWSESDTVRIIVNTLHAQVGHVRANVRFSNTAPGERAFHLIVDCQIRRPNSVTESSNPISDFGLVANYPNPFNSSTRISFSLSKSASVSMRLFDPFGRSVADVLPTQLMGPGAYQRSISAEGLTSGSYIVQLKADNQVSLMPLTVIK